MPGDVSLKGIEFVIKGSTDGASRSLDSLISKLGQLQKALADTSGVKKLSTGLSGLKKAIDEFGKADMKSAVASLKELGKVSESLSGLANISKDLATFAKSMSKLAENAEGLAAVSATLRTIAEIDFSNLATAGEALKNVVSALSALSNGSSGGSGAEKQVSVLRRLFETIRDIGSKSFKATGKMLAEPFKKGFADASKFVGSLKGVVGGFKRILGYRIIRAVIKEITQAFREGITNLYGWSQAFGGAMIHGKTFAETMDGVATSLLYFKNSAGAAVSPLISALAPALDYVIDKVVTLLNLINQLLARLAGATSWNRAIKKATQFGAAAGGAGEKAKEAMRYLAPFDELNRLPAEHDGGSGGGGGGSDVSGMFEEVAEFNEELAEFADRIRDAIDRSDWEGLGKIIGDKINELVDRIDFAGIGTKVGEKINALFTTQYWTLKTINFQNIGKKVAEFLTGENGIGGALREIDFSSIGGLLAEKMTLLWDVAIGFVNNLDFSVLGKNIGDFARGFFDDLTEFVENVDWGELVTNIIKAIGDFFRGADIGSLSESILHFLNAVIHAVAEGVATLVSEIADAITNPDNWKLVWAWMQDLPAKFKNAGINAANSLVQPVIDAFNNFMTDHPKIAKWFGFDEPIEFKLIPNIPESELNKNYNKAKAEIEAQARKRPPVIKPSVRGKLDEIDTSDVKKPEISAIGDIRSAEVDPRVSATIIAKGDIKVATPSLSSLVEIKAKGVITDTAQTLSSPPVIPSKGNITTTTQSLSAKPVIDSTARLNATIQSLTKPVIDSTGRITTTTLKDNITKPNIESIGKISSTLLNSGLAKPSINSIGNISDAIIADDVSANVKATAAVTDCIGYEDMVLYIQAIADFDGGYNYYDDYDKPGYGYYDDGGATDFNWGDTGSGGYSDSGKKKALGGAFYGGLWHNIPQFASGGRPHGSIFWAGESGAELVGHVGGRTEVINKSQLASTMYSAVTAGIARTLGSLSTSVVAPTATGTDGGLSEDTLYRAFLRALNDADNDEVIELDGDVVYKKMVQRNRQNTRRTGVNAMMTMA